MYFAEQKSGNTSSKQCIVWQQQQKSKVFKVTKVNIKR